MKSSVLILGTGIAGLSAALKAAAAGARVTLICKADPAEGATRYAQGGIASVWSEQDTFEDHKRDTLSAGDGLCKEDVVELCVREGPNRVRELINLGVDFTRSSENSDVFDLHREGGHGKRRILHANDLTGWAIEQALLQRTRETPGVQILSHHTAIDLITEGKVLQQWRRPGRCLGAYVLSEASGEIRPIRADVTILATGGAGKAYLYTSNPDVATGDGIAMAYRAGAKVANLEFMQFHPTCLFHPGARTFLISEALRGEGAVLRTLDGENLMARHHPLGSLAPRDVVARAIDMEMKRTGDKHVLLDCSAIPKDALRKKFPNIHDTCLGFGIDITTEPIPVVPAAHYSCGGVLADLDGKTTIEGLYAIGEVACTGLHGANRLASNSLLEAVVFAHRAVNHAMKQFGPTGLVERAAELPAWDQGQAVKLEERIDIAANWLEVRSLMWNYVGIVRSDRRLKRAEERLALIGREVNDFYWNYVLTRDLIELRNLVTVAGLIVRCAQLRRESRGLHYTVDYPGKNSSYLHDSLL